MILEYVMKEKVSDFMGKLAAKDQSRRLERERLAARVANLCSQEFDRAICEFERHMVRFIHKTIKEEMR